ncbi:hypothetical protein NE237_024502 [Protea cynaroides]|uniref:Uncharacterized protein n=1 Tax=Protea cynaroides TaxID=273540 RepID=A0A9Q0JZ92_9MAGN|nr:hypothetical protein NE237_024502 [Protea cynaroides]
MAISDSQTPHENLDFEKNPINPAEILFDEPPRNKPYSNHGQKVWRERSEGKCDVEEFPPLVSSPTQTKNLNPISEKNPWSKPPLSVTRQQKRFNLRFIPLQIVKTRS